MLLFNICIPVILFVLLFIASFLREFFQGTPYPDFFKANIFIICWGISLVILCNLGYTLTTWIIFLCPLAIMTARYFKNGEWEFSDKILTMATKTTIEATTIPTDFFTTSPP